MKIEFDEFKNILIESILEEKKKKKHKKKNLVKKYRQGGFMALPLFPRPPKKGPGPMPPPPLRPGPIPPPPPPSGPAYSAPISSGGNAAPAGTSM